MRCFIALALIGATLAATNKYAVNTDGSWYENTNVWSSARYPRTGDVVEIPSSSIATFQDDEPAYMQGASQGQTLVLDGSSLIVTDADDGFILGDATNAPQDCGVKAFGAWSACTKSCGGGSQKRTRNNTPPRYGGILCPHSAETRPCNGHTCAIPCVVGKFGGYTACTKSCGTGTQSRSRSLRQPENGGTKCPHAAETRKCNAHACPKNCRTFAFGKWTACTKSCGTGSQRRQRLTVQPQNGGSACPHSAETRACNKHSCPSHCRVSQFSGWTACTKSCGTGSQSRSRSVLSHARNGGYTCPYLAETRNCNAHNCPVNCNIKGWKAWTTCTKSCGTGTQSRSRTTVSPSLGGKACPHSAETRKCNTAGCPVNCKFDASFGAWSTCTKKCGTGSQKRTRSTVEPQNGGKACPHSAETRACNKHSCAKKCSHTTCEYKFSRGEWRTIVKHEKCAEQNGDDFHCEHHFHKRKPTMFGTTLFGDAVKEHKDECVCYCHLQGESTITHSHFLPNIQTPTAGQHDSKRTLTVGKHILRSQCSASPFATKK